MELRNYQVEARDAILHEWDIGHKKTLLVLPTGCGKTVCFADVIRKRVKDGGRVLVLAHRGELLDQAADKIMQVTGLECAYEKAEQTSFESDSPITVGSVQTMFRENRLNRFDPEYYKTIVVDEAHHCLSDTYQRVLNHFSDADVLGVTATPDRGDKRKLGQYFDSCAYEYSLRQAVKDGYLSSVKAQMIPLEMDLSKVSITSGDYSVSDIGIVLEPFLQQIADEIATNYADRKTVVFLPLIHTSQAFCEMLNKLGMRAAEVNGNSKDRAEILKDFEDGKYQVLCNSMLLTEGWDCPSVDCICVLRPTKVRSLYQQMVGRGMRLSPGKSELLLLDFLWLSQRHDLCRPSSLIAKDADIAAKMDERVKDAENGIDILEAEEAAEKDAVREREEALAEKLAAMRKMKRKLVDPLQYALSIMAEDLAAYEPEFPWQMEKPSDKQIQALEKWGIYAAEIENKGKAAMLMDRLIARREAGLTTPKQIRLLERYGFREVGTWSFDHANKMIRRIAALNWTLPYDFDPSTYQPARG